MEVEYDDEADPPFEVAPGEIPSLISGGGAFPNPTILEVRFDVYIPHRIQQELIESLFAEQTSTEHFRVQINYTFHAPVAFVEPVGAHGGYRPSTAVQVVREYLEREMNPLGLPVAFEFLGPSPFHAEFYLEERSGSSDANRHTFTVEHLRARGYSDVNFYYPPGIFDDGEEALDELYFQLGDELGLFYDFTTVNMEASLSWEMLQEEVLHLTETPTPKEVVDRVAATWKRGKRIHDLHGALLRFEANQLLEKHRLDNYLRSTYATDEPTYLKPFLDAQAADRPVFPTQQIGQLLSFLEERRNRSIELLIVLVAALIGGIAGSLVTLLAQR